MERRSVNFAVENTVAILRKNSILTPDEADTPARRIYLTIQLMYVDPKHLLNHQKLVLAVGQRIHRRSTQFPGYLIDHMNELI
jgi:flagellar biosynthesis regulator FlbT